MSTETPFERVHRLATGRLATADDGTVTVTSRLPSVNADDYIFLPGGWRLRGHKRWTLVRKGRRVVAKMRRVRNPWRLRVVDDSLFDLPGYALKVTL